ncbi:MAG: hypothetical protein JWN24_2175 [Phycisphaerales bacterium]|nr:hypothetical protein [Phycisphaerales bacterium]
MPALRSSQKTKRSRTRVKDAVGAVVERLEVRLNLSANVLTYHNDAANTGVNSAEVQLTPANVQVGSFGKLFTTPVDGQVYAQPLIYSGVTIGSGVNTAANAAGVHDVVFVATENDVLYAIDAGVTGGAILWQRSFRSISNAGGNQNNTLGATAISALTSSDVGTTDISPNIGITGTPVIDPATGFLYLVAKTKETINGVTHFVQRLHAINTANGTDAAAPFLLGDTTGTNTNSTSIYVYGTGDGNVTDPYNATGKQVVQFNALTEAQRGALNLVNNTLYIDWASHGDNGPYHGWIVSFNVSNLAANGFKVTGVLNTSPNNGESGIWEGGGRLAFETDGSAFYFMTGNGTGGKPVLGSNGLPVNANYNEALVKAVADPTTSPTNQNPNGWGLKVADYFVPYNVTALDGADSDFGSGAPVILPDSAGVAGHPHLLAAGGKDGRIYLIDRDNLGHFDPVNDHVVNAVPNGNGNLTPPNAIGGILNTPAWYNGKLYALSGYGSLARTFAVNSNGTLSSTSQTSQGTFGYLPGSPSISSNGASNGIVWMMDRANNQIHAYDANTLSTQLWYSGQAAGGADNLGAVVKFAVPTIANGEVYVGTTNSLVVYGLTPPAGTVPMAPVLSATALSGSSINLTWTDSGIAPNLASGYLIEQSTDNVTFKQITTAPAGARSIAIGGLAAQTTYYFRIRGYNGVGNSAYSNAASAATILAVSQTPGLDFSGGFAAARGPLTFNGPVTINGSKLQLTSASNYQETSVFSSSLVGVTGFNTQFTFQLSPGANTADGFTFTLQGAAPTARGLYGIGLGYAKDPSGSTPGVQKSVAIKFDLYNNAGEGPDSTGLYTNAAAVTNVGSIDLRPSNIDLHSGHVFQVNLSYDGATLTETITDTTTAATFNTSYPINIPAIVGANSAYVGFTAGTGGLNAVQSILNWTYSPIGSATVSPNAPSGLGAIPSSATSVFLSWTNNAANQTGYHLDRATDAGFTQNLITETLPASPASFTDVTTGLAPGGTYYYRLRAFNAAGDSGNTNPASVTIPVAPPKPTLQQITAVSATGISFSWQDNAGHAADGYKILRAVNHGSFVAVATLPPTSRPAPSTYSWSDTNLAPGTYYEYHILAYNVSGNNDFAGVNATTLVAAPNNLIASSVGTAINLSWTAPTGAVSYNICRGTSPGGEAAIPVATGVTTTTWSDSSVTVGTTYYYVVTAVNANASYSPPLPSEGARSNEASAKAGTVATPGAIGVFNNNLHIGAAAAGGSASYSNGTYTVAGSGTDIWGATDGFQYLYNNVNGDATLVAKVASIQNTSVWAKAGLMFRAGTAANAPYADVVLTSARGAVFQWRNTAGGSSYESVVVPIHAPTWLKLVRSGNTFSAFYSADGVTWKQIGVSETIVLPTLATAGLAVTSVNPAVLNTSTFTNVSIT